MLLVALALGLAWLFGAVALNAPGAKGLREAVQQSAILRALNDAFPPSSALINVLHRIDPRVSVQGPSPDVAAPDSKIARDPEVRAASGSVVRVLGTACGLGVEGSGWVAAPGLVVTNAHVVAGESDTTVTPAGSGSSLDAIPVHYDPSNDLALLRVNGLDDAALSFAPDVLSGTPGAVLGYPENGPLTITPARAGATGPVITQDSYGRGPGDAPADRAARRRPQRQLGRPAGRRQRQGAGHGLRGDDPGEAGRLRGAERNRGGRAQRLHGRSQHRPLHALVVRGCASAQPV